MPKKPKDPVRVAAGKKSKNKGASFERKVVNLFKTLGYSAEREVQYCGNTGDAKDIRVAEFAEHHFECKSYKSLGRTWWDNKLLAGWVKQCIAESKGRHWFLIFKENGSQTYVLQATDARVLIPEGVYSFCLKISIAGIYYTIYEFVELFSK